MFSWPVGGCLYLVTVLTLSENLQKQSGAALHKCEGASRPGAYLVGATLAGAFIGLADIFMMTAAGPLRAVESGWTPLVQGGVFGIGLILVMYAGGELATSAMMILPIGLRERRVGAGVAAKTFGFMVLGNLIGSVIVAGLVRGSGIMAPDTAVGQMLVAVAEAKAHKSTPELFFRGILCNILVCLAVWTVGKLKSEITGALVMAWCMAAFVTSGFEHVVANMTTLALALFHGVEAITWAEAGRNLVTVGLGNIVGGAVFVATPYMVWHGRRATE